MPEGFLVYPLHLPGKTPTIERISLQRGDKLLCVSNAKIRKISIRLAFGKHLRKRAFLT
jgi:hypothetical protein